LKKDSLTAIIIHVLVVWVCHVNWCGCIVIQAFSDYMCDLVGSWGPFDEVSWHLGYGFAGASLMDGHLVPLGIIRRSMGRQDAGPKQT